MGYINGGETYNSGEFAVQLTRRAILPVFLTRLFLTFRNAGKMAKNKSKQGKVDDKVEHQRVRALKRFKDQNPDYAFVKLIRLKQKAELARIAGDEA